MFNVLGAVVWSGAIILLGYGLGHIPGVADFVSNYIDLILVAIVVLSVVPVLIRSLVLHRHREIDAVRVQPVTGQGNRQ